jgi:hypothetical protein
MIPRSSFRCIKAGGIGVHDFFYFSALSVKHGHRYAAAPFLLWVLGVISGDTAHVSTDGNGKESQVRGSSSHLSDLTDLEIKKQIHNMAGISNVTRHH